MVRGQVQGAQPSWLPRLLPPVRRLQPIPRGDQRAWILLGEERLLIPSLPPPPRSNADEVVNFTQYDNRFATFCLLSLFSSEEELEKTGREELASED